MEKKLFEEVERHLLNDDKPSEYLRSNLHKFKNSSLSFINEFEKIEQSPVHHPEGNVLNHMLLVVDGATLVKEYAKDKRVLMWSAMFHDIGKIKTTKIKKGRITAYEHDTIGTKDVEKILNKYDFLEEDFKNKVKNMVRYHMHSLYIAKGLPFGDIKGLLANVEMHHDMILLFFADKIGRGDFSKGNIERVVSENLDIISILEEKYKVDLSETVKILVGFLNL